MTWAIFDITRHLKPLYLHAAVIAIRAGRSPPFQDPGTPSDGLAGTRVPASPIEHVLSFKALESPLGVQQSGLLPANLT